MDQVAPDMSRLLVELTADIVSAHVANNNVAVNDVPTLVLNVHSALSSVGGAKEEPRPEPAVPVRKSVKKDHIVCLDCGKKMKMLKRHLSTEHDLTPDEYRQRWDLDADYPIVAPEYAETRAELAKKIGLGRKPGQKRGRKKST